MSRERTRTDVSRERRGGRGDVRLRPLDLPSPVRVRTDQAGRPVAILPDTADSRAALRAASDAGSRASSRGSRANPRIGPCTRKSPSPCGIAAIREVWRIDDEWWRDPVSRLYHDVVLENGKVLTLYRDLIGGGWWRQ